jgi:hypothetical protein
MPKIPVIERFFKRFTIPKNENECWLWTGGKDRDGYGQINSSREKGVARKCLRAHRISYEHFIGEIPKGYFVCHTCDNPSCVNPKHLWAGTSTENNRDCARKKRTKQKGESNPQAKLTANKVREIRKLKKEGITRLEISKIFNIHVNHVNAVCRKATWKHID